MSARYLIRLDDARPRMDAGRWNAVEQILSAHEVKPLVAIIPDCQDAGIDAGRSEDSSFWSRVKQWQDNGWGIALHGHTHALRESAGGLVPLNSYSEFVGLPFFDQRDKIGKGYSLLLGHGLKPVWWVAPAHGFDEATLDALRQETPIRLISDGLSTRPYSHKGFSWFPQQLWKPRGMKKGFWTICFHPDEMRDSDIARLDTFLSENSANCVSPEAAASLPLARRSMYDLVASFALLTAKRMKRRF